MANVDYQLMEEKRPRLGVIVLQVDETIEDDLRQLFHPDHVRLHITRIPSGAELNPETIRTMETQLPAAAGLLPPAVNFDAVAYACTSGTTLIGASRVAQLVHEGCTTKAVTDPLTAALAAVQALRLGRIGIVSPYIASVAGPIRNAFIQQGIDVPDMRTFGEEVEANVARIAPGSIKAAARALAASNDLDGIFLSCTNLRTLAVIPELEAELAMPILSSNQVLAWHIAKLAAVPISTDASGLLFAL
ncbi:MAG: Asp/Glu racemase [Pseudomonadota bacterium]